MEGSITSTMNYEPKFDRVIVKREITTKTLGGIIIPDTAAKRHATCTGVIVALGETAGWTETYQDGELVPVQTMKVGDTVVFGRHAGAWLDATYGGSGENDDGQHFICGDRDILAVIRASKQAMKEAA